MDLEQILRNFLDENKRLTGFPAKRKMKVYALFYLAEKFEGGRDQKYDIPGATAVGLSMDIECDRALLDPDQLRRLVKMGYH